MSNHFVPRTRRPSVYQAHPVSFPTWLNLHDDADHAHDEATYWEGLAARLHGWDAT